VAAYRADIQIGVSGQRELERLRSAITQTSEAAESLNRIRVNGGRLAQSLENYNTQLERAQRNLQIVATASQAENKAITEYVTALGSANAARARQNDLIEDEIRLQQTAARVARLAAAGIRETSGTTQLGPGPASPVGSLVGQKSPVAERINQTLQARKDEIQLQAALLRLEEKSAATLNEKLELQQRLNRAALAQGKLDVETVSAQQAQRQQFLAGKSGTAIQGPLAGPGAMGFPVALSLSKVEQQALEVTAKKQEILQRMVTTRQTLVGLADNLRRIDQNAANQIKVAIADAERLNAVKLKELQITQQIRASEGAASNAARQRLAQEAARRDRIQNAGFGIQGPALPPGRAGRSGGGGRLGGAISGSIIGGSFPLLFGQGAGAAAGGAVGGLVGGLAGPGGSFAGSLLGTLLGDIASQGSKVKDLAADIGFSAEQTERLKNAFALAGQEADKFEAATQNIRGLGLSIDDQADAITLAANLTEAYGGKIDKVAAAYANFVEKGKVGIADINKFTSEGIPILDQLEKKYNTNRDGILKLAKDGEISAQALSDARIAIGNSSDTAAKKTVSGWDKAWADIKAGGSLLTQAVGAYFNALVGGAGSATSSIAESFGTMFKNIVQNSIDATAALARNLAALARFAANISATAELGGLNIGATASKNAAKNIEKIARNFDAGLQKIKLPEPGKVGAITIPGQAPAGGGGGGGAQGPKPPEDRTAQLMEEFNAIVAIGQAEDKIRDLLFDGRELLAAKVELQKQIADIERDRNKALITANYESERVVITKIAEARIVDAQLKQQDKIREINQKRFEEELQVQEAVRSSVQSFTDMRKEQELQVQYAKTYSRLLMEGMLPAEAERIANFEKTVAAQLKAVDLQLLITSAAITEAQARGASTFQLEKDLDLLERKRKAIEGEAAQGPGAGPTDRERLQTEADRVRGELNTLVDPINMITNAAAGIGDAFSASFKGVISGSMTAKEALASFFTSVADMFLDMAAQIIAKMITMAILNTVVGLLPGGSMAGGAGLSSGFNAGTASAIPTDAGGWAQSFATVLPGRANGGPVSSGQTYMVGERGPELFVPGRSGTIVPNDKMGGGGGVNVVVNVDASGSKVEGDEQEGKQLGRLIAAAIQQELVKQKRPGGLLT